MSEKEHTPRWKKLLILLSLLPLLWWPVSLLHDTGYIFNKTERLLMILFPFYALISVALAWYCRNERPEVMWIEVASAARGSRIEDRGSGIEGHSPEIPEIPENPEEPEN